MAFVYLIEDQGSDNYLKIGATRGKMEKRLKTLQTGNGNEIRMHSFYETEFPFQLEKMLHLKFGNARKKGEWFEYRNTLDFIIDKDALFLNKNGKRMNEDNIKAMFRIYSGGKLTPHMMRHEYTTVLQRESNDPTFVREQGRWKSNAMMNNVYDSGASRSASVLENM